MNGTSERNIEAWELVSLFCLSLSSVFISCLLGNLSVLLFFKLEYLELLVVTDIHSEWAGLFLLYFSSQMTTNILRKYSGPLDIWLSILSAMQYRRGQVHCLLNEHPKKSFLAMSQHRSQWVWCDFLYSFNP